MGGGVTGIQLEGGRQPMLGLVFPWMFCLLSCWYSELTRLFSIKAANLALLEL